MHLTETVLTLLCDASKKYIVTVKLKDNEFSIILENRRPSCTITKKLFFEDLPKNEQRRDQYIAFEIAQAILELDDIIEQSFRRI